MKTRRIVVVAAGAVALAMVGCSRTAQTAGDGQGYRGGRYAASAEGEELVGRAGGPGRQAFETLERRETVEPASDRTGRDVADTGTLRSLAGKVAEQDGEWYLEADARRYLLHLGNASFVEQTGLDLKAGASVDVRWFVDGQLIREETQNVPTKPQQLHLNLWGAPQAGGLQRLARAE